MKHSKYILSFLLFALSGGIYGQVSFKEHVIPLHSNTSPAEVVAVDFDKDGEAADTFEVSLTVTGSLGSKKVSKSIYYPIEEPVTGITETGQILPKEFKIYNNYPNSFNPETRVAFDLREAQNVLLEVYNTAGQKVATLVNGQLAAGNHLVKFNAASLSSGIYFYKINAGSHVDVKRMSLIK